MGWVGIDLHVHTPASNDYQGGKEDEEFVRIAQQAADFQVDTRSNKKTDAGSARIGCLAFTDHNSVDGYVKYGELLAKKIQFLDALRGMDPNNDLVDRLKPELDSMKAVRILMGVEVSCDPGIHMLLIFRESVKPTEVQAFIAHIYGHPYSEVAGRPELITNCTIIGMLDNAQATFGDDVLVVAPHVDSDSGLIQGLREHGLSRIAVVNHPLLAALSFIREDSREYLRKLAAQPDYRRLARLALVQSSDFHGRSGTTVGQLRTEVSVSDGKPNFQNIRAALTAATKVKCSVDFTKEDYDGVVSGRVKFAFKAAGAPPTFNSNDAEELARALCGLRNSLGGIIELEILADVSTIQPDNIVEDLMKLVGDKLERPTEKMRYRHFQFSPGKGRLVLLVPRSTQLESSESHIYLVRDNTVAVATAAEVEGIVGRNIAARFGERIESSLEDISRDASLLARTPLGVSLLLRVEDKLQYGIPFGLKVVDYPGPDTREKNDLIHETLSADADRAPFGLPQGCGVVIKRPQAPREKEHYLRFLPELTEVDDTVLDRMAAPIIQRNSILVAPGGVSFLTSAGRLLAHGPVLAVEPDSDTVELAGILAWIKSSFFIWYCAVHLGNVDLFLLLQVEHRRLPFPKDGKELLKQLATDASNVMIDERKFLSELNRRVARGEIDNKEQYKMAQKHNSSANRACLGIDKHIYKFLGLREDDVSFISQTLRSIEMSDYGAGEEGAAAGTNDD
jgi:hypothetical protein